VKPAGWPNSARAGATACGRHPRAARLLPAFAKAVGQRHRAASDPAPGKTDEHSRPDVPDDRNEHPDDGQWQEQNKQERERKSRQDKPGDDDAAQYKNADSGKRKEQEDSRTEQGCQADDESGGAD
jgi:hypothetical protein